MSGLSAADFTAMVQQTQQRLRHHSASWRVGENEQRSSPPELQLLPAPRTASRTPSPSPVAFRTPPGTPPRTTPAGSPAPRTPQRDAVLSQRGRPREQAGDRSFPIGAPCVRPSQSRWPRRPVRSRSPYRARNQSSRSTMTPGSGNSGSSLNPSEALPPKSSAEQRNTNRDSQPMSLRTCAEEIRRLAGQLESISGNSPELNVERQERQRLSRQVRELESQIKCVMCLEKDRCIAFQPCFHLVSCRDCQNNVSTCPLCRAEVEGRIRVKLA